MSNLESQPPPRWADHAGALTLVLALVSVVVVTCSGCASVHMDAQGQRHVVGLLWLTLPPADVAPVGGTSLRARGLGLVVTSTDIGSAVVLGYSDSTHTVLRNDSQVAVPAHNEARENVK